MSPALPRGLVTVGLGAVLLGAGFAAGWVARDRQDVPARAALPPAGAPEERSAAPATPVGLSGAPLNVIVLVGDDIGQDMLSVYGLSDRAPPTPNLDALAARGVRFEHAVMNPLCSPSRAGLLTGRAAWRYGVGNAIPPRPGWDLPVEERTLAGALEQASEGRYTTVALGKWHLATPDRGGWDHPRRVGFDHHIGTMGNLMGHVEGAPQTYTRWQRVEDGVAGLGEGYLTSATVDDALAWATPANEPFFLWVGFHAAHFPMHAPPAALLTRPLPSVATESDLYRAMVEAMDTEIGRLVQGLTPEVAARTLIVFLGDNGSAPAAVEPPFQKSLAKGTLARGGTEVPLIVAGPGVQAQGAVSKAIVGSTDLFATVAELAGMGGPMPEDSISFAYALADPAAPSRRGVAWAERFGPNGPSEQWTYHEGIARDERYKLLLRNGVEVGLYDLIADPMERHNLFRDPVTPEMRAAVKRLRRAVPEVAKVKRTGERGDEGDGE